MGKILRKLNILLDKKQKRIMLFLIVAMLIGAALELMGVGLIYEAASVIMDPDILESSATLAKVYDIFHMESMTQFSMLIMGALIGVFALKNVYLFSRINCSSSLYTAINLLLHAG